jgi:hypothetical protein
MLRSWPILPSLAPYPLLRRRVSDPTAQGLSITRSLDSLVRDGLCTADKRDALLAYPGYVDENAEGIPWPAALRRASHLLGGRATSWVREDVEDLLRGRRQGLLWPYHTGTLVTSIDSALVLQGFRDPAGVDALETFAHGRGGYLPQLCSEEPERDRMTVTPQNRHWCQPDYGTTYRGAPSVRRLLAEVLQDGLVRLFVRHQYLSAVGHGSRFTL